MDTRSPSFYLISDDQDAYVSKVLLGNNQELTWEASWLLIATIITQNLHDIYGLMIFSIACSFSRITKCFVDMYA